MPFYDQQINDNIRWTRITLNQCSNAMHPSGLTAEPIAEVSM